MPEHLKEPPSEVAHSGQTENPDRAMTVKLMERMRASEALSTPEQAKVFLDSLDYESFKKWISFVNGIQREIPAPKRGQVANSHVESSGILFGGSIEYRPPHESVRNQLLQEAFDQAKKLNEPDMAGLTLGLSINAIHYFADGNGRTARMVYALLQNGYDGSAEAQAFYSQVLEETKGQQIVNPNPAVSSLDQHLRREMYQHVAQEKGYDQAFANQRPTYIFGAYDDDTLVGEESREHLLVAENIDDTGREMLHEALQSGGMEIISLMAAFPPERVGQYIKTSSDGRRTYLEGGRFLPTLTPAEIKQWWTASHQQTVNYVHKIIHFADRPDAANIAGWYRKRNQQIPKPASEQ